MGTATFVQDFKKALEFTPVEGQPNLFLIHSRGEEAKSPKEQMTSEDWDDFERHIKDIRAR